MSLMLFGLLCLCFVSFVGTEKLRGGRTATRKLSERNDAIQALFSMIDAQIKQDNTITEDELKQAWRQHDSDKDDILTEDELKVALEKLKLGYSKEADYLFAEMGLSDEMISIWIENLDANYDGTVTESDLEFAYNLKFPDS